MSTSWFSVSNYNFSFQVPKQTTKWNNGTSHKGGSLKNIIFLCYFKLSFLPQPTLETALQNINLNSTVKSINRAQFFQPHHPKLKACIGSICTIALSTVILFLKYKPCRVSCQLFFNDRMISTNIWKSNTSSSQTKAP